MRALPRVLLVAGTLAVLLAAGYGAGLGYLSWRESRAPSTGAVLVLKDGRRVPLIQPAPPVAPTSAAGATPVPAPGRAGIGAPAPTSDQPSAAALPPLRVRVPRLGLDWPVVLSDGQHLPRFKGVGWLLGSAYPGQAGNLVLLGHLDGPYATFGRLHELGANDTVAVVTEAGVRAYRVRTVFQATPDDVAVLAPTDQATLTIITCSGRWDPRVRMYDHRLIVIADLVTSVTVR
ncbi:MAG TPA: sortase [Chloroflexia bacterium]|nr:sortase [Chloroflexia bacterium]